MVKGEWMPKVRWWKEPGCRRGRRDNTWKGYVSWSLPTQSLNIDRYLRNQKEQGNTIPLEGTDNMIVMRYPIYARRATSLHQYTNELDPGLYPVDFPSVVEWLNQATSLV